LTGTLPFDDDEIPILFSKIKKGKFKTPDTLSSEAKDILRQLLEPDPLKRIRFYEIKNHAFMQYKIPFYLQT
jgi:serine/threonine protein kinase